MSVFCWYMEGKSTVLIIAVELNYYELAGIYFTVLARSIILFNSVVLTLLILL